MSESAAPTARLPDERNESSEVSKSLLANKEEAGSPRPVIITTAKRKGITYAGLLPTIFVISVSFGLGSTLLIWLVTHQSPIFQKGVGDAVRNGTFIVDEGSTRTPNGDSSSHLRALTFSALAVSRLDSEQFPH